MTLFFFFFQAQELKEVMISYCIALKANGAITEKELDQKAEDFIKAELTASAPKVAEG